MKNLIMLTALLMCCVATAQKKKPKKVPPPPPVIMEIPPPRLESMKEEDPKKCFLYKAEEKKDNMTYVTETLLEYGWNNDLARIVTTTYEYDHVKKKEAEDKGFRLIYREFIKFTDGVYKIDKNTLTFTPTDTDSDNLEAQYFKIVYKPKTKKIDFLMDSNNNKLEISNCLEVVVGAGS